MEEVPTFVLAVAIAAAVIIVLAPLFYVMSKPVVASAPYFAVKPAGTGSLSVAANGMLVNVSIADFYARPKGAFWYVDGRFAGYGNWTLVPCGANVTAVAVYPFGTKEVSGRVVCTRPFTVAPAVNQSVPAEFLEQSEQAMDALFQGAVGTKVTFSYNVCSQSPPPLEVTLTVFPRGAFGPNIILPPLLRGPQRIVSRYLVHIITPGALLGYYGTYSVQKYFLMPWAQGGDEVPFLITLTVGALWSGNYQGKSYIEGYYIINITNLVTGQSYTQRMPSEAECTIPGSGAYYVYGLGCVTTLASGICATETKTVSGTYTIPIPIYPNGTPEVVQGSIYVNGKKVYYGPIQLVNDSGQLYVKGDYISPELYFTANNPIGSVQNGALQINVTTSTSYTTCLNLWKYGVPSALPCVPVVTIVTGTKTYVARPWGPIGYNTLTGTYTYSYSLTFINIFPGGGTYYYSLYPFQAPVLAFTDHDASAGPKYVS
jgi:hypothetical protein